MEEQIDDCSSFSDSNFDSDGDCFELGLFSSSSSSLLSSSSSSSSGSENGFTDFWSDTSFSFASDDSNSAKNTFTSTFYNENVETLETDENKLGTCSKIELDSNDSEERQDDFSVKITIDKHDSSKSASCYVKENGNHSSNSIQNNSHNKCASDKNRNNFQSQAGHLSSIRCDEENPFCDICGEVFDSQAALDVHKLNHLVSELYKCEICGHESKNREDFVLHSKTHDQNHLSLIESLGQKKAHPSGKPYRCDTCSKSFRFISNFKKHIGTHIKTHICHFCGASFPTMLLFHQHTLKHAKKRIHQCKVCNKTFQRAHQLNIHMQVHETDKKYNCLECGTSYCYKTSLMRHALKYHSPDSPKFQCEECGELFKSKKMLNGHIILHTAKKLIHCPECDETFKYRSSFHRHRRIHQSLNPFRCKHCGKLFSSESILKAHKELHFANENAYICKLCDKTFAFESFLNKHMLTHESVRSKNSATDQSD